MRGRKDGGLSVSTCAVAMVQGCRTRAVWLLLGLCLVHVPRSSTFFASLAPMARRGEAGGPRPERLRLDSVPTWGSHPLYKQAGRAPAPSCAWNWWWSPKWPNLAVALNQAAWGGDGPREEGAKEVVRANDLSDTEAVTFFEAPELTMRDIATMTVPQLKEELRERGLRVGGKKDELLQRLQDAIDGKITAPVTTLRGGRASGKSRAASAGKSAKVKVGSGSGIRLAEGERLPVAPPMEKVMQMDSSVRRIFVRGLPFRASPRDVASILEDAFGRVESLEGMTLSGRSTGRAWVTFEHASTAMEAVAEHTIELDGRPIHFSPPWSLASRQALREMAEVVPCYVYILGCNLLCVHTRRCGRWPRSPSVTICYVYTSGARHISGLHLFAHAQVADYEAELRAPSAAAAARSLARDDRAISADYAPAPGGADEDGQDAGEEQGGRTVFVGRIPSDATEEDVVNALAEMGEVEKCYMGNHKTPHLPFPGYAHVVMKDEAGVVRAINTPVVRACICLSICLSVCQSLSLSL